MSVNNPRQGVNRSTPGSNAPEPSTFEPSTGGSAFGNPSGADDLSVFEQIWNGLTGRTHQANMQREQQEFDEYMYRTYNSPEALKRQFKEAGINTNLIGSTSFGTASSAAGAPAVNGSSNPLGDVGTLAESVASAASLAADPALKSAQTAVEMTLPDLNRALTEKYGADAALSEIQYQSANQLLEWSRQDRECNAMSLRLGFFQSVQNYKNSKQQFENMVKEGKILDNEANRSEWAAKIEEETFNMLINHHYLPDADFLTRIYIDYVQNGDFQGFDKYIRGFTRLEDARNRSAARFGAYGNSVKIGPVEVPIEYLLQSGKDLAELVDDIRDADSSDSSFKWPWQSSNSEDVNTPRYSKRQVRRFERMKNVLLGMPENQRNDKQKIFDYLLDYGYYPTQIAKFLQYLGM